MEQLILNNEEEFKKWTDTLIPDSSLHFAVTYSGPCSHPDVPQSYPCVVVWHEWDVRGSSHDGGCHSYIYPHSFNQDASKITAGEMIRAIRGDGEVQTG